MQAQAIKKKLRAAVLEHQVKVKSLDRRKVEGLDLGKLRRRLQEINLLAERLGEVLHSTASAMAREFDVSKGLGIDLKKAHEALQALGRDIRLDGAKLVGKARRSFN